METRKLIIKIALAIGLALNLLSCSGVEVYTPDYGLGIGLRTVPKRECSYEQLYNCTPDEILQLYRNPK